MRTTRRELFRGLTAATAWNVLAERVVKNGRLRQSVSRWPYQKIALAEFCRACADIGLAAIDLLEEPDWDLVRQYGLICSMGYAGGGSIADGLNVKANHDKIVENFERMIPRAARAKVPNVITFFGNRKLCGRAESHQANRRGSRCDDLGRAAQQQGQSP